MSDYDEEYSMETIIEGIVERAVRREVDRLAAMEKVPVYVPGTPGAMGPRGLDGKDCDESRLDALEERLRAMEMAAGKQGHATDPAPAPERAQDATEGPGPRS